MIQQVFLKSHAAFQFGRRVHFVLWLKMLKFPIVRFQTLKEAAVNASSQFKTWMEKMVAQIDL